MASRESPPAQIREATTTNYSFEARSFFAIELNESRSKDPSQDG